MDERDVRTTGEGHTPRSKRVRQILPRLEGDGDVCANAHVPAEGRCEADRAGEPDGDGFADDAARYPEPGTDVCRPGTARRLLYLGSEVSRKRRTPDARGQDDRVEKSIGSLTSTYSSLP